MVIRNKTPLLVVIGLICVCGSVSSQEANPGRLEIRVVSQYWNVFNKPIKQTTWIRGANGSYKADGKTVDGAAVSRFLKTIDVPPKLGLSLANLDISQGWLDQNAEPAWHEYVKNHRVEFSRAQEEFFTSRFRDAGFLARVLCGYEQSFWTDDYPEISIEIHIDKQVIQLSSRQQREFMIPWTVSENGHEFFTYNAAISRALAEILPKGSVHRARLAGSRFRYVLSEELISEMRDEWDMLDSEAKIPGEIARVRERFSVVKSEIACVHLRHDGNCWRWRAYLRSANFPQNVSVLLWMPYKDGRVVALDEFFQKIDRYTQLVLSVPWFKEHMERNRNIHAEIFFVRAQSLDSDSLEDLLADLRDHGKAGLAAKLESDWRDAAYLHVQDSEGQWSEWVTLPSREMLLWRFSGDSALGFPASSFPTWDSLGQRGVGILISEKGEIER